MIIPPDTVTPPSTPAERDWDEGSGQKGDGNIKSQYGQD